MYVRRGEGLELEHRRAREQRAVDVEIRVLGGGGDQGYLAVLDIVKQTLKIGPVGIVPAQSFVLIVLKLIVIGKAELELGVVGALLELNADTVAFVCDP